MGGTVREVGGWVEWYWCNNVICSSAWLYESPTACKWTMSMTTGNTPSPSLSFPHRWKWKWAGFERQHLWDAVSKFTPYSSVLSLSLFWSVWHKKSPFVKRWFRLPSVHWTFSLSRDESPLSWQQHSQQPVRSSTAKSYWLGQWKWWFSVVSSFWKFV